MGYRKAPKRDAIIAFIASGMSEGKTFGEIQRFICEMNGRNYNEMREETVWRPDALNQFKKVRRRTNRGYFCTYLVGPIMIKGIYYSKGFLSAYCFKNAKKKYVLKIFRDAPAW